VAVNSVLQMPTGMKKSVFMSDFQRWILLFVFPSEFIRIYWVVSLADAFCLAYVTLGTLNRDLTKGVTRASWPVFVVLALISLFSAAKNPSYSLENLIHVGASVLAFVKAVALLDAIQKKKDFYVPMLWGYLSINAVQLVAFVYGNGYTGSGRFTGIFPQSNGMAAFETFSLIASMMAWRSGNRLPALVNMPLSVLFIVSSGSRGSMIAVMLLVPAYLVLAVPNSLWKIAGAAIALGIANEIPKVWAGASVAEQVVGNLGNSSIRGVRRIVEFFGSASDEDYLEQEFSESRGQLNSAAMSHLEANMSLLGTGIDSSQDVLGLRNRVHNIFLLAFVELGLFGFIFFVFLVVHSLLAGLPRKKTDELQVFLYLSLIAVLVQAMKTPYYFNLGTSWAVLIAPIQARIVKRKFDRR
jgi:hypothetical protein